MKLASKKDVEAPIAKVWAVVTDFESWERSAMRRGVEVARTDSLRAPGVGMAWHARFAYRAKQRKVDLTLTEMAAPGAMAMALVSPAVEATTRIELIEMSAKRTRIHVTTEIKPRSLGARLFLQSLRLARAKVDRKFDARIAQFAAELEARSKLPVRPDAAGA
ncbi:SRPBCC family protein [Tabrizicola sp.]|jgi:carbon monoxide dehydrogenase subunit G|uniref:SRPBCC family protein n=1 Tax=Tabrizicola sp. TaxID=2005166 RepID=UPI003D279E24